MKNKTNKTQYNITHERRRKKYEHFVFSPFERVSKLYFRQPNDEKKKAFRTD